MLILLKDYNWNMPLNERKDVFIPGELCQTSDNITVLNTEEMHNQAMIPNDEMMNWLNDNTDFCIHSPWPDGCSIFLVKPTNETLVEFKLLFPMIRI